MRILHITNSFRSDGTGITNVVADLAIAQSRQGNIVRVACHDADPEMTILVATYGVEVVTGFDASGVRGLWRSARRLSGQRMGDDIVHVHTVRAVAISALSSPPKHTRSSIATIHNPYQKSAPLMYLARRVVSISNDDARRIARRTMGLQRPLVIHNSTLGSRRLPAKDDVPPAALPPNAIVFTGALNHRKGVDVLLRAMVRIRSDVPDAELFLIGNRDNPEIERLSVDLGLDSCVHFEGYSSDPRSYMVSASVFVLPARAEGFGLVLTEARSCGVPIIASNVGGIPEALDGGRAGWLVEPDDEVELAKAIVAVLSDPELAAELRRRAVAGLAAYSVSAMAEAYVRVYRALARARTPGPIRAASGAHTEPSVDVDPTDEGSAP